MKKNAGKAASGFTLIEFVMVILLVGIVSVVVLPKWSVQSFSLQHEARRLLSDIRYAQALSMTSGQRYRWVRISASSYRILNESGVAIVLPAGSTTMVFTSGVTMGTLVNLPNGLLAFDALGAPYTTSAIPGTALAAPAIIPLTSAGQTQNITITPQTGWGTLS